MTLGPRLPDTPFYFLRHGETDWNVERRVMGHRDVELNEKGRDQAARAARFLKSMRLKSIVASPLLRARETADLVAAETGLAVAEVEDLRERGWGEREGHTAVDWPLSDTLPDGAESMLEFKGRVLDALTHALGPAPCLVVSHGGVLRVILDVLALEPPPGRMPNAQPLLISPVNRVIRPMMPAV